MTLYPSAYEQLRLEYYSGCLLTSQEIRGQYASYRDLRRTWQISLLAKRRLFDDDRFDHRFVYYDPAAEQHLGGRTAIITLELEKLEGIAKKPLEALTEKERWGLFFRYCADEEKQNLIGELIQNEEGIAMAAEVITKFSADEIAYFREISEMKYELDMRAHRDEAWEEGLAAGQAAGLEQGRVAGIGEGSREKQLEIARNFKAMGLSPDQIAQGTGLPAQEIAGL